MLKPEIDTRAEMTLVGIVGTGASVTDIDIAGLWERFVANEPRIPHKVDAETGYELHIEKDQNPKMHFTIVGIEVEELSPLPIEMFAKSVPGGPMLNLRIILKMAALARPSSGSMMNVLPGPQILNRPSRSWCLLLRNKKFDNQGRQLNVPVQRSEIRRKLSIDSCFSGYKKAR